MTYPCAPVFLGASCDEERAVVRAALAAHPRFFTSHLPADDASSVRSWAEAMSGTPFSRRPVWLSEAAFDCIDELKRFLPQARFVRVVHHAPCAGESVLEIDADRLMTNPLAELERILSFLGEATVTTPVGMRRCA